MTTIPRIVLLCVCLTAVLSVALPSLMAAETGTDPASKYAWSENAGWVNAAPPTGGVTTHFNGSTGWLGGCAWAENVGWIRFGDASGGPYSNNAASDWGVNLDADGRLSGFAWGENIGWIRLDPAYGGVSIDPANGRFSGYAWGENVGWLAFGGLEPPYGVRTLAFDTQAKGTPNWWLDDRGVSEEDDEGDGVPAWKEYVADTDPNDDASYLRITAVTSEPGETAVTFWPSSLRRRYTLVRSVDLSDGVWSNVVSQALVPGTGGSQTMRDAHSSPMMFYRVQVSTDPR